MLFKMFYNLYYKRCMDVIPKFIYLFFFWLQNIDDKDFKVTHVDKVVQKLMGNVISFKHSELLSDKNGMYWYCI